MGNLDHKRLRSRRFRLELLESRELLSVIGLPDHPAAAIAPLAKPKGETITGTMSGGATLHPTSLTQGTTKFTATGNTTVLGSTTLSGSVAYSTNKQHVITYTKGTATLVGASGDITVSYTGSGKVVAAGDFTFSVKGSVTGGTGTFAKAAGKFSASGSNDLGAFSIQLTATLTKI